MSNRSAAPVSADLLLGGPIAAAAMTYCHSLGRRHGRKTARNWVPFPAFGVPSEAHAHLNPQKLSTLNGLPTGNMRADRRLHPSSKSESLALALLLSLMATETAGALPTGGPSGQET